MKPRDIAQSMTPEYKSSRDARESVHARDDSIENDA